MTEENSNSFVDDGHRFRALVQHSNDVIWFTKGLSREVDFVSPAFERVWGVPPELALKEGAWFSSLHPEDREVALSALPAALQGYPQTVEYRIIHADGSTRWIRDSGFPIKNEHGDVVCVAGIAQDITREVAARKKISDNEIGLSTVLEALPIGVIIADSDGRIVRDNAANKELWGGPPPTASAAEYGDWIGYWPNSGKRLTAEEWAMARALKTGEVVSGELVQNEKFDTGERRYFLNNAAPIRDGEGAIQGAVVAQLDITDRVAMEAALAESESRFRNMADFAPVMMWITDEEGHCSYLNRSWFTFTGQSAETALGHGWLEAVHPAEREQTKQAFLKATGEQSSFRIEYRLRRADGEYHWCLDAAAPRYDAAGKFVGFIGSVIDIQDQKEADELQRLLNNEINHRAKNMMAIVQAIVQMTSAESVSSFKAAVQDRVATLGRTHNLLSSSRWQGANLEQLLTEEFSPFAEVGSRVHLSGAPLLLAAEAAQALGLAVHELITNSAKYGALSVDRGQVSVSWEATAQELQLVWVEQGGPPIGRSPSRRGFGSTLLRATIERQLKGTVAFDWKPEGLRLAVSLPLSKVSADHG